MQTSFLTISQGSPYSDGLWNQIDQGYSAGCMFQVLTTPSTSVSLKFHSCKLLQREVVGLKVNYILKTSTSKMQK